GVGLQEEDRLARNRRSGLLGVVDIVQADRDEFGHAGYRSAEPRLARDGRERGGGERGQLLPGGRRVGLALQGPDLAGQGAQLAGFIDQAGLFRTLIAVANKLHSSFLPWKGWFCLERLLEQWDGKFNSPKALLACRLMRVKIARAANDGALPPPLRGR